MVKFCYRENDFYLDDKKIVIMSGAIHYFRVPKEYWKDRLLKLKECGLNTVETYVPWNLHEKEEGCFDFKDNLDLGLFLDIANDLGLKAIVRPGPFICAEWEAGGFPYWLKNYKGLEIRKYNELYLEKCFNYLERVVEILKSRVIENGGNVIMVQIENEYGAFGADKKYLNCLYDFYNERIPGCLLVTSDGAYDDCLINGSLEKTLMTVNFGSDVEEKINKVMAKRAHQPYMCMEFWCGWFDHWYGEHTVRSCDDKLKCFKDFLKNNYSFNIYMFHGGTNFGFMNGANIQDNGDYLPTVTSYDYDGILTESGDRTDIYYKLKELIESYTGKKIECTAKDSKKGKYGKVHFSKVALLKDNLSFIGKKYVSKEPLYFEECNLAFGYMYYVTNIKTSGNLDIGVVHDRAILYENNIKKDVYFRNDNKPCVFKDVEKGNIGILVENLGRINFGSKMFDYKGIKDVKINGKVVEDWECYTLPMDNIEKLEFSNIKNEEELKDCPAFYKSEFEIEDVNDTFLKTSGFKKGIAIINGHNLGRYFNISTPTKTLYVPAPFLKKGKNELIIFESDGIKNLDAEFVDKMEL